LRTAIAVLNKKGDNVAPAVITALKSLRLENSAGFGIASSSTLAVGKDIESLRAKDIISPAIVGYAFSEILPEHKRQLARLVNATLVFEGRVYSMTPRIPVVEVIAEKTQQNRGKALETLLEEAEGDFSFVIAEPETIIAGRDPMGVQPLYFGENKEVAALASNRKALWKLGIEKTQSFPPGNIAYVSHRGFRFKPVKTLVYSSKLKPIAMEEAAVTLQKLLERSVRKRASGLKEVAVAFSGGLDSSVIAFLANRCCANVHLIHVSLKNRLETEEAKRAAEELKLPIHVYLFEEDDVEKVISRVVELVEEPDPVKASIGVPFYWTAEKTAEAGFRVLLAGQGADELFGGYQRYVNDYLSCGEQKVRKTMFDDIVKLHESNIERDVKICNFHDVELRLPFASYEIAEFALSLPAKLKMEKKAGSLRKLVLRKAARNMGLPASIAGKPKRAVQYSTGINDVLKKIAKRQNRTTKEYVNRLFFSQYYATEE
jgi:asparagine synthase (glutamine-hydrolysing)